MTHPGICLGIVVNAVKQELEVFKKTGKASPAEASMRPREIVNLVGLQECIEIDRQAGRKVYAMGSK